MTMLSDGFSTDFYLVGGNIILRFLILIMKLCLFYLKKDVP